MDQPLPNHESQQAASLTDEINFNSYAFHCARAILLDLFPEELVVTSLTNSNASSSALKFPLEDCDTPFAVGAASCAIWQALARVAIRETDIDTGSLVIDPDHCVLSLREDRYLLIDGEKIPTWEEFSGVYECTDGSLCQLHCNFPSHRDAVLEALDHPKNASEAKAICKQKFATAVDLESKVLQLGGASAAVRRGVSFKNQPCHVDRNGSLLVDIVEVEVDQKQVRSTAETRQAKLSRENHPTTPTLRVIDMTRVLAGPVCTRVMKQLEPKADILSVAGAHEPQIEGARLMTSVGKRSAFCDLQDARQLKSFHTLLDDCDVFVQSYRPNCLSKFGLSDSDVCTTRPGLVKVNIRAYEGTDRRGFDSLMQCYTGMFDIHSKFTGRQEHLPVQALDYLTGMLGALGAFVALRRRRVAPSSKSVSYVVNVSLERTAKFLMQELPLRSKRYLGGLQNIESRILRTMTKQVQLKDYRKDGDHSFTLLRSVLERNEDEHLIPVTKPGKDSLLWLHAMKPEI